MKYSLEAAAGLKSCSLCYSLFLCYSYYVVAYVIELYY